MYSTYVAVSHLIAAVRLRRNKTIVHFEVKPDPTGLTRNSSLYVQHTTFVKNTDIDVGYNVLSAR